jgi:hypothetical protein
MERRGRKQQQFYFVCSLGKNYKIETKRSKQIKQKKI